MKQQKKNKTLKAIETLPSLFEVQVKTGKTILGLAYFQLKSQYLEKTQRFAIRENSLLA